LREQILEGAPADVFASANESVMAELVDEGSIASSVRLFAGNRLRIAVPAGNPGGVGGLDDFDRDELLIGLCAEGVPCGALARTALSDADIDPAIDTNEPDVRALLTRIAADELDAGIVYVTDVRSAGDRVEGIDLPPDVEATAPYPIAVVDGAPNPDGAEAVIGFVLSPDGQAILAAAGFETP
jgi:molybdate transport system substrate-binding protein